MNTRAQVVCAWATVVSVALILVGFLVAGWVPPPKASESAAKLAAMYRDDTDRIRIGVLVMLLAFGPWAATIAAMSTQLARVEGPRPALARLQSVAGTGGYVCLLLFALFLLGAAFRPERDPEITQALHDLGWFMAFLAITPFVTQAIAVAAVVLKDTSAAPVFPRWFGYFNAWVAFLLTPGCLLAFFKTGPFAYHGIISFWIPLIVFAAWMLALAWGVRHAALGEATGDRPAGPATPD